MRGYELIYPSSDKAKNQIYEKLLQKSNDIFDEFTTGKNKGLLAAKIANEALLKTKTKLILPKNVAPN